MRNKLFQEELKDEPFWMLVACILVNRSRWKPAAENVFAVLRKKFPTPGDLAMADLTVIENIIYPLGFQAIRSKNLKGFSKEFTTNPPQNSDEVYTMSGCGEYAADSWAVFIEGDLHRKVSDEKLKAYLKKERERC